MKIFLIFIKSTMLIAFLGFFQLNAKEFKITKLPKNYYKYDACFQEASETYGIPMSLLKGVALTENLPMNPNAKPQNKNKTYDHGLMQVNSIFLNKYNLTSDELMKPCINIKTAAKILANIIDTYGYSWESIGRYHSSTPKHKKVWLKKLQISIKAIAKLDNNAKTYQHPKDVEMFASIDKHNIKRKAVIIEVPQL